MPIDIDRFEDAEELHDPSTSERIIQFLVAHDDQAYTRQEIADAIGATPETVGTNLTRLKERGLVRHREPYWTFTDDRDQAITTLRARYDDAFLTDLLGIDDLDEWKTQVVSTGEYGPDSEETAAEMTSEDDAPSTSSSEAERTTPLHREAASVFFERVLDHFDDAIDELYLFGSVARDTAAADSDVDVLAVISDDADYAAVDDQLLDIAYDVQLEYGVRIELHSIKAGEFATRQERGDPFIRTVVEEGEAGV